MNPSTLSRRSFLAQTAVATAALTLGARAAAPAATPLRPIIAFSKPFQNLDAEQTAAYVAEIGWDGIECPVRAKGQIEPTRVADDLPRFTTALRDLAAACKDLGLQAGFQNHSGHNYVGAPIWDVFSLIRDLDPAHCGMCFDIGHATIEGGLSWPTQAKLIAPFYTAVYIKDFSWQKTAKGWTAAWCPLGEGMINRSFITTLKNSTYTGPISQHHEYELGDAPTMSAYFKKDLAVLKSWLA